MYVQCFRQIVDKNPTPQNYVLLGDAFMAIEEPDKALEIYEQVWTILHEKVGRAKREMIY